MTLPRSPGIAGAIAGAFIRSKLTPLVVAASLFVGGFALWNLPREEEPQINVPMFDIFVPFPGASAKEVETRIVRVGERKLWEIPGVEYIYSTSEPGFAMFIVRFKVGTDPEEAATRIFAKTSANMDALAMGAMRPLVKPRSIDDVPVLALTLYGDGVDPVTLRKAAASLRDEINGIEDVSEIELIGGRRRQYRVHFSPDKLRRRRLTPLDVSGLLQASNVRLPSGRLLGEQTAVEVETDAFIRSKSDLESIVVGISNGETVRLKDVAEVSDGPDEDESDVRYYPVAGARDGPVRPREAVTLSISKRRGTNATMLADRILHRVERARGAVLPDGVELAVTRNYGESAKEKSDELIFHMLLATASVALLIAFALGFREAIVVLIAIPVTLALTLLVYFLMGYTLNRITLFALIFSIGILVDDAIVVVENIHRHYMLKDGRSLRQLSVDAAAEVGNPTILATWAVIAAILPMAFVRGLMGPYMRPIPVGASVAMVFSLVIAFMVSPWAFSRLLEWWKPKECGSAHAEGRLDRLYRSSMGRLLDDAKFRAGYFAALLLLLAGAAGFVAFKAVTVKMLPHDNKDEFEVILNLPESSPFETTERAAAEIAAKLAEIPEARQVVNYVGTAAPYNFNGLVRHYFLRQRPYQSDIVVKLSNRHERSRQSHAIAGEVRPALAEIARRYGARLQVAEVPPGPPVLATMVFEIYGPDAKAREGFAEKVRELLKGSRGIVDVDAYIPDVQPQRRLHVDREKVTLNGLMPVSVVRTVGVALSGETVGLAHLDDAPEPVEIRLRLAPELRGDLRATEGIRLFSMNGTPIPLGEMIRKENRELDRPIYHKNLRPVTYVTAEIAGAVESPVYAILNLRPKIAALARESGVTLTEYFTEQPKSSLETALKWDGEWQITYEVFRDMGIAFALVLVLIYILVVAWFKSFAIPLVIMLPIPLTLVGILPAHWAMGAFFTATSMIGFIAGAGIVVRNSIILVDFIELRLTEGAALRDAVIEAGVVRFRPMLLTAAAVIVGAGVILFDPIFQGLAISLIAGEVASTLLSRTAVPVLYFLYARRRSSALEES